MASSDARSKSEKVKFLDSKQAYVRAMNADGLTIIEGTGTLGSIYSPMTCAHEHGQQHGVRNAKLFRQKSTSLPKNMLRKA